MCGGLEFSSEDYAAYVANRAKEIAMQQFLERHQIDAHLYRLVA